jgi:hypothetical protein
VLFLFGIHFPLGALFENRDGENNLVLVALYFL